MLNIDLMSEQEVIELIRDEKKISDIIQGKIIAFYQGEEQILDLSHLFERISPNHQDNDEVINIAKISNMMYENIKPHIKATTNNTYDENLKVCEEAYAKLIRLINKLSIKRAKELVSIPAIKQLFINPKINTGITYTVLSVIEKPSVLKILNEYLDTKLASNKAQRSNIKATKLVLKEIIKQQNDSLEIKQHFETELQRITDRETNYKQQYAYFQSTKGMITHLLSKLITNSEERKIEKQNQANVELNEKFLKQFQTENPNSKRR